MKHEKFESDKGSSPFERASFGLEMIFSESVLIFLFELKEEAGSPCHAD
jgi:hypothetical protein